MPLMTVDSPFDNTNLVRTQIIMAPRKHRELGNENGHEKQCFPESVGPGRKDKDTIIQTSLTTIRHNHKTFRASSWRQELIAHSQLRYQIYLKQLPKIWVIKLNLYLLEFFYFNYTFVSLIFKNIVRWTLIIYIFVLFHLFTKMVSTRKKKSQHKRQLS